METRLRSPRCLTAAAVALAMLLAAAPAGADTHEDELGNEAGLGAAAGVISLVYAPTKLLYAAGGSIIAGLAWAFSGGDADVARPVLNAALRGDYVVTPTHLREGRWPEFVGRSPEDRRLRDLGGTGYETEFESDF